MLLKANPVSRISVLSFINPMFGVLLSALSVLREGGRAFSLTGILALILVCLGIVIVNMGQNQKKRRSDGKTAFVRAYAILCVGRK